MSSREEFEAWINSYIGSTWLKRDDHQPDEYLDENAQFMWESWQAARAHESDLLAALKAITNSGPDAIPIKEAFEMAHRAIERATGGKV